MENSGFGFSGMKINGFVMIFLVLAICVAVILSFVWRFACGFVH